MQEKNALEEHIQNHLEIGYRNIFHWYSIKSGKELDENAFYILSNEKLVSEYLLDVIMEDCSIRERISLSHKIDFEKLKDFIQSLAAIIVKRGYSIYDDLAYHYYTLTRIILDADEKAAQNYNDTELLDQVDNLLAGNNHLKYNLYRRLVELMGLSWEGESL